MRSLICGVALSLVCGLSWAATYEVTKTGNAGAGSLRWAIEQANAHAGEDHIEFDPSLAGAAIAPLTELPPITGYATKLRADINSDGRPDVTINGIKAGAAWGLRIERTDQCVVSGLAVINFQKGGILLSRATTCTIRSCHVGVRLDGATLGRNGGHQIKLYGSTQNTIGATGPGRRNTIAAGSADPWKSGIHVLDSSRNTISSNHIGVNRDGDAPLTAPQGSGAGITLAGTTLVLPTGADSACVRPSGIAGETEGNTIGPTPKARNVIGGMTIGVDIVRAERNSIPAGYFGLGSDGESAAPIEFRCIRMRAGSRDNMVGSGNEANVVFANALQGIRIEGAGNSDNMIRECFFGLNAQGTARRPMKTGVSIGHDVGPQKVLSSTFCGTSTNLNWGVIILGGEGSVIGGNTFGSSELPIGRTYFLDHGITAVGVGGKFKLNDFHKVRIGMELSETPATAIVSRSCFQHCGKAILLVDDAHANLGNVNNRTTVDDGYNRLYSTNNWIVYNDTGNYIRAEGNYTPVSPGDTAAKVWDKLDDPTLGRVDLDPNRGTVSVAQAGLCVAGAAAVPSSAGAQIVFSLSSAAEVDVRVRNVAGRAVASVCSAADCKAGANTVLWSGRDSQGLPVPSGTYLIEIAARSASGERATALTRLAIAR